MARTRGPGNLVAHRPRTEARTDTRAHADYAEMITHDLGRRRQASYRAVDDGRPMGAAELLLRPMTLFLLACTAFVAVLAIWLWQAGVFGQLQRRYAAPPPPIPSSSWIGARQARTVAPVDATTDNAFTPMLNVSVTAPAATPADEASSDADAAVGEAADTESAS